MAALLGDLTAVSWTRRYRLLAALDAEHPAHDGDCPTVTVGQMEVCAIDRSLIGTPDTP